MATIPVGLGDVNVARPLVLAGKLLGVYILIQIIRGIWWLVNLLLVAPPFDPLRHLPGPDAPRLANHFRDVMDPELTPNTHENWVTSFGKTLRYHGFGAVCSISRRHAFPLLKCKCSSIIAS